MGDDGSDQDSKGDDNVQQLPRGVVSLAARRGSRPPDRVYRPARAMAVGGGATDRFTNQVDFNDLHAVFAALDNVEGPPHWFVVDASGRLVANSHPQGWAAGVDLSALAEATRSPAFLATLETGVVAQLESNDSCLLSRMYASALLLCVIQGRNSGAQEHALRIMADIDAHVGHTVALLRRRHPGTLQNLVLADLFSD